MLNRKNVHMSISNTGRSRMLSYAQERLNAYKMDIYLNRNRETDKNKGISGPIKDCSLA
jgi:hypothetical protein